MTCDESKDQLAAFHFGELALHERTQLEEHLSGCLVCVRELIDLFEIDTASFLAPVDEGPDGTADIGVTLQCHSCPFDSPFSA